MVRLVIDINEGGDLLARIATGHGKADNWIDLAGYAVCGGELEDA